MQLERESKSNLQRSDSKFGQKNEAELAGVLLKGMRDRRGLLLLDME